VRGWDSIVYPPFQQKQCSLTVYHLQRMNPSALLNAAKIFLPHHHRMFAVPLRAAYGLPPVNLQKPKGLSVMNLTRAATPQRLYTVYRIRS
jgi:hypothetical protein